MKLYYFLGRMLKPVLTAGFFFYCIITRTSRVRIIVRDENDRILLIKTWLSGNEWSLPGGGVDRGETYEEAACRELREETGIEVAEDTLVPLGVIRSWGHEEVLFSAQAAASELPSVLPSRFEVKEARWFLDTNTVKLGRLAQKVMKKVASSREV